LPAAALRHSGRRREASWLSIINRSVTFPLSNQRQL